MAEDESRRIGGRVHAVVGLRATLRAVRNAHAREEGLRVAVITLFNAPGRLNIPSPAVGERGYDPVVTAEAGIGRERAPRARAPVDIEEPSAEDAPQTGRVIGEDAPSTIARRATPKPHEIFIFAITVEVVSKCAVAKGRVARQQRVPLRFLYQSLKSRGMAEGCHLTFTPELCHDPSSLRALPERRRRDGRNAHKQQD